MFFQKRDNVSFASFFWGSVPFLMILALIFITLIPGQLPFKAVNPPFPLIAIFFWAVFRPDALSAGVIFFAGLMVDLLTGVPIGAHAFLYVLVFSLSKSQRRFLMGQGFVMLWFSFLLICLIHQSILWVGYFVFKGGSIEAAYPLLFGGAIVAALLPVLFPILIGLNNRLDRAQEEAL